MPFSEEKMLENIKNLSFDKDTERRNKCMLSLLRVFFNELVCFDFTDRVRKLLEYNIMVSDNEHLFFEYNFTPEQRAKLLLPRIQSLFARAPEEKTVLRASSLLRMFLEKTVLADLSHVELTLLRGIILNSNNENLIFEYSFTHEQRAKLLLPHIQALFARAPEEEPVHRASSLLRMFLDKTFLTNLSCVELTLLREIILNSNNENLIFEYSFTHEQRANWLLPHIQALFARAPEEEPVRRASSLLRKFLDKTFLKNLSCVELILLREIILNSNNENLIFEYSFTHEQRAHWLLPHIQALFARAPEEEPVRRASSLLRKFLDKTFLKNLSCVELIFLLEIILNSNNEKLIFQYSFTHEQRASWLLPHIQALFARAPEEEPVRRASSLLRMFLDKTFLTNLSCVELFFLREIILNSNNENLIFEYNFTPEQRAMMGCSDKTCLQFDT